MNDLGKFMVIIGLALVLIGAWLWSGVGTSWFGHLPGDLHVQRERFSFHFPIVTCLVISVVLTVLMWLLRK